MCVRTGLKSPGYKPRSGNDAQMLTKSEVDRLEAVRLFSEHGSYAAVERATGINRVTVRSRVMAHAKYHKGEALAASSEPVAVATAPDLSSLAASIQALVAVQAAQSEMLARLAAGGVTAPVVVPAAIEPIRVLPVPREHEVGPLGSEADYEGEIYGVVRKRKALVGAGITSKPRLTIAIGDTHFHPAILPQTLRAMTLAGLHVAARAPEHLVHIGDVSDLSSVCRHTRNDTWKARLKPSIRQDLDCLRTNWKALNAPIRRSGILVKKHMTKGNHCAWLDGFEDDHPELHGLATGEFDDIIRDEGWTISDFGESYFIGEVTYVHVPLNLMGRPVGGQTAENTIAMQSTRDTVSGHTHRYGVARRIKLDGRICTAVNTGSCMPEFFVGEYAQLSAGRRSDYGILEVTDFDGRIQSHRFVPLRELEALYGTQADALLSGRA